MLEKSFLEELIKKPEKISKLQFEVISKILVEAKNIFEKENLLLEFNCGESDEIYIIGDIHGNLESLTKIIEIIKENKPKLIISLGDIVDRGPKQLECLIVILALKILKPNSFYILKGNHETLDMNQAYGFFNIFLQRFKDYEKFNDILALYNVLPYCAIVNNSILCLHGGIPKNENILKQIQGLKLSDFDDSTLRNIGQALYQIIWNDPKESGIKAFTQSFRGPGIFFFGNDVFQNFMRVNNLKYLIRAHECFPEGYRWFFNNRLLSIFSSANYRGIHYPNPASYAIIKNDKIIPKTLEL